MDKYKNVRINFNLRESDDFAASLSIKDGKIATKFSENISDVNKQDLSNYFSENIPKWEKFKFNRDTGGAQFDENGKVNKLWDGVEEVTFEKNPYEALMYIFVSQITKDKKDIFHMKYIIELKTPPVL